MPVTAQSRGYSADVDAGADADLEDAVAGLDAHPLDRLQPARMQRRTEDEVVDRRELLVDAVDEVVLDGRHRQRARRGVRPADDLVVLTAVCVLNSAMHRSGRVVPQDPRTISRHPLDRRCTTSRACA